MSTTAASKAIPRLFYLAVEHSPAQPSKSLQKYLPQFDLLAAGSTSGVNGAAANLRVKKTQLAELYNLGKKPNRGTSQEYKVLAAEAITSAIDDVREDLTFTEYLALMENLNQYVNGVHSQAIVPYEEVNLGEVDVEGVEDIQKWNSGYSPIDEVTGGLYQGIVLLVMKPGSGKTSHMLRLAEACRNHSEVSSIWFFEAEIPRSMMLYRMKPIIRRTAFKPGDRLVCGFVDVKEIVQRCVDNPDPNRVIFIDSPDAIANGQDRRFALEEIYRSLNWIKSLNKSIVVSSQPRRNDRVLTQESVSDSWAKAWYSDIIITGSKLGRVPNSASARHVSLKVGKNRFGPDGGEIEFEFDYESLDWQAVAGGGEENW